MAEKEKDIYFVRYRLCENVKADSMSIEGIIISKKWKETKREVPALTGWVRSYTNPKGLVEKDVYEIHSGKSILLDRRIYSSDELMALKREQIVPICESWDIKHSGIKKDRLIEILCTRFEAHKKIESESIPIMPSIETKPEGVDEVGSTETKPLAIGQS